MSALRPAALLGASEVAVHFVGSNLGLALLAALLAGATSMAFAYVFSDEWARFFSVLFARARGFGDGLIRSTPL